MAVKRLFFIIFLSVSVLLPPIFAQPDTHVNLPDGAVARFGKGKITVMRYLADGTLLAVGTDIGVWIYDVSTGNVQHLLAPHPRGVDNFVLSPDRRILASSGCKSGVVILWDLNTGKKIRSLRGEVNVIGSALAFSKDGQTLVGLYTNQTADNTLKRWDVATTRVLSRDTSAGVGSPLACSPDNTTFGGVSREGKIKFLFPDARNPGIILGRKTNNLLSKFSGRGDIKSRLSRHSIITLTFSADGKTIATGDEDGIVRLWDATTRTEHASLKARTGWITAIAFTEDNSILASGDTGKHIHLWDARTGEQRAILNGHAHTITALTFAPDGKTLASGSLDGTIRFWDINTAKELSVFTSDHIMDSRKIAFSKDNTTCVTSTFNGKTQTWDIKTGHKVNTFTIAPIAKTDAMALSPDATLFAFQGTPNARIVTSGNGNRRGGHSQQNFRKIRFWDLRTEIEIKPLESEFSVNAFTFSPDNKILATAESFKGPRLWDMSTGRELLDLNVSDKVLAFSSDGKILATGGNFRETHVWDVNTGNKLGALSTGRATALAFSPDNSILAIGTRREIHLWNLNTGQKPSTLLTEHVIKLENNDTVSALIFSPDGKILLAGIKANKVERGPNGWESETIYGIQLWDVQTTNKLTTFSGHSDEIESLQFSHDGKMLASTAKDSTVLLWDGDKIANQK